MATNSSGNVPQLHQLPPVEHNLDDIQDKIEHEFDARKDRRQACLQALHPGHNGRKRVVVGAGVGPGRACRRCDRRVGEDGVVDHQEGCQCGVPGKAESECYGGTVGGVAALGDGDGLDSKRGQGCSREEDVQVDDAWTVEDGVKVVRPMRPRTAGGQDGRGSVVGHVPGGDGDREHRQSARHGLPVSVGDNLLHEFLGQGSACWSALLNRCGTHQGSGASRELGAQEKSASAVGLVVLVCRDAVCLVQVFDASDVRHCITGVPNVSGGDVGRGVGVGG